MKKTLIRHILPLALSIFPTLASSQGLSNEITVERDIIPELRDATRIGFLPKITLNPIRPSSIQYSYLGITTQVPNEINVLDPVAYGDTAEITPWKGYVSAGLFPLLFNGSVSAGYRIYDSEKTHAGAWLQYDGTVYKRSYDRWLDFQPDGVTGKTVFRHNTVTIGGALDQRVGTKSLFSLQADYTYSGFNFPEYNGTPFAPDAYPILGHDVNRYNVSALWHTGLSRFRFGIGASVGGFHSSRKIGKLSQGQVRWQIGGTLSADINANQRLSLNVDFSTLRYRPTGSYFNNRLLRLVPAYHYTADNFIIDAGVKFDIARALDPDENNYSSKLKSTFHVAPDVRLTFFPKSRFSVSLYASGGDVQNSYAYIYDNITPYFESSDIYTYSNIPLIIGAKARFIGFKGFYAEIYGEYGRANHWLMPVDVAYFKYLPSFEVLNMSGVMGGIGLGYSYKKYAEAKLSAEASPRKFKTGGYYLWRDRAKMVVDASLRVTPIEPLDLTLAYQLRLGRSVAGPTDLIKIGNVSNLSFGASWRFSPRLSFFVKGENLLNNEYLQIGFVPSQGINGLIGAAYKF